MKTNLILLASFLFLSFNVLCQEFATKPFTISNNWIEKELSINEVKEDIPEGYIIALEEAEKLVLEKDVNSKNYEIKVYFGDSKVTGIMFTQHIDRVWKLMDEIEDDLNFKMTNSLVNNGIERNSYENQDKTLNASLTINESTRIITCFFNIKN
ncbi:MAG: hypothetical protein PHW82_01265 [Bacteroidales bacterium]|nr:hypothetical protein [Bacteroidales bacterium]